MHGSKKIIFQHVYGSSWWEKSTHPYLILPCSLFSATHFSSTSQHALLPRSTKLCITQPIISSSSLFNLRIAPCSSEQVLSPRQSPLLQAFISLILQPSPLGARACLSVHLGSHSHKDEGRKWEESGYMRGWRTRQCERKRSSSFPLVIGICGKSHILVFPENKLRNGQEKPKQWNETVWSQRSTINGEMIIPKYCK